LLLSDFVGAGNAVSCHFQVRLEQETPFLATFKSGWSKKRRFLPLLSPVGAGISCHFQARLERETPFLATFKSGWSGKRRFLPLSSPVGAFDARFWLLQPLRICVNGRKIVVELSFLACKPLRVG